MAFRRKGYDEYTVHGFRSAFADFSMEQTNVPYEVREAALAHQVKSAVERAYRRGDLFELRRNLMDRWAHHIEGRTADVVPMKKRA
jgi:integrase